MTKKQRIYYANYIAMMESMDEAMEWLPEAEHEDIRGYVELEAYQALERKLDAERRLHETLVTQLQRAQKASEQSLIKKLEIAKIALENLSKAYYERFPEILDVVDREQLTRQIKIDTKIARDALKKIEGEG